MERVPVGSGDGDAQPISSYTGGVQIAAAKCEDDEAFVFDFLCRPSGTKVEPTRLHILVDTGATTNLIGHEIQTRLFPNAQVRNKTRPRVLHSLAATSQITKDIKLDLLWHGLTLPFVLVLLKTSHLA